MLMDLTGNKRRPGRIRRVVDDIQKIFSPTARPGAKPMEATIRRHAAEQAQSLSQSFERLEDLRYAMSRLSDAEMDEFTHNMETGQDQATPELQMVARGIRAAYDHWTRKIQGMGRGHLSNARENYMGHIYRNYAEWRDGLEQDEIAAKEAEGRAKASNAGKGPILGSRAFMKQRSFETLKEAMEAGLEPVSHNPLDIAMLKIREMQKFYHGTRMADAIKAAGLAHWIPYDREGGARAAGWLKMDDPIFQPRIKDDEYGTREVGNWYAPEPVATVFNNYVSRGLGGSSIFQGLRQMGNALNMAQLGLSAFHFTFVTMDSMVSTTALGIQEVSRGQLLSGAKNIALGATPVTIPITATRNFLRGAALRRALLSPETATPDMQDIMQMALDGGARIKMDSFFHANASGAFFKSMRDLRNPGGVFREAVKAAKESGLMLPFHLAARVLEQSTEPLMAQWVPKSKLGVFANMAESWMKANPNATPEERSAAAIQMWDSVDNRMGQLVYDNVFWNKTLKDMAFVSTRSVGWNLGTIRELGGGIVDAAAMAKDLASGGKYQGVTSRMAYWPAMMLQVMMMGAVITYLRTGEGPKKMLDYFFPPDAEGNNRIIIPSYVKDVIEYAHAPMQTLFNKMNPLLSVGQQIYNNRDYYGGIIYDSKTDNFAKAYMEYMLNQTLPFSIRGIQRQSALGSNKLDKTLAFWGFAPAPAGIVNPEKGQKYQDRADRSALKRRNRESGRIQLPGLPTWLGGDDDLSGAQR